MGIDFIANSVAELADGVRTGITTARELTDHALERIGALNAQLVAFVAVDAERARADADEIDRRIAAGADVGPLAGIPIGVKDLEDAAGFVTTYGSDLHTDDAPATEDSPLVARLKAAGCVVIGKTNTPEYGHKGATDNVPFGVTSNPWSPERSPGGSSGGSAAAIASGMVPLATGSDGGGSIRIPAALCGLSGIKTTQGRVPLGGPNPPGSGPLSVKGPMAWRIRDVALALDAVVGPEPTDIFSLPAGDPWLPALASLAPPEKVVWSPTMGYGKVDAEIAKVLGGAVETLAAMGTEIIEMDDIFDQDPVTDWIPLWAAARYKTQGHLRDTEDWDRLSETIKPQIVLGERVTGADHARALDACHSLNLRLDRVFERAPLILCPVAGGQTPVLGHDGTIDGVEHQGWVQFTYAINMTRNPAGTVNAGFTADGMPVGLQIIGRQLDDVGVLRTIAVLEGALSDSRLPQVR